MTKLNCNDSFVREVFDYLRALKQKDSRHNNVTLARALETAYGFDYMTAQTFVLTHKATR